MTKPGNPYKGLHSYEEGDNEFFYGREKEVKQLSRLIKENAYCIIFGKSGIGKTSLLNAGVFPKLEASGFLPIRIRLNYSNIDSNLLEQIKTTISTKLKSKKILQKEEDKIVNGFNSKESLWGYFRRVKHIEKDTDRVITPVLVFDQFEEIFTIGKNHRARDEFIDQLHYLIDDEYPISIKKKIMEKREPLNYIKNSCSSRLVISIREDYYPSLRDLKSRIHCIDQKTFRVKHMNGIQAGAVIKMPKGHIAEETAVQILKHFYPKGVNRKEKFPAEDLEIEPSILSLLCYQLFEKGRTRAFSNSEYDEIIADFYVTSIKPFPRRVKRFIELSLLTEEGYRSPYRLEPNLHFEKNLNKLVERRILRKFHRGEEEYIEIIHDVLTPIIKVERSRRSKIRVKSFIGLISLVAIIFVFLFVKSEAQHKVAQINLLAADALIALPTDNTRAIRIAEAAYRLGLPNPPSRTSQALFAIAYSSTDVPFYNIDIKFGSSVRCAVFSPDGLDILVGFDNGSIKLLQSNGKNPRDLIKYESTIMSATFSPNGKRILIAPWKNKVALWDLTGNLQKSFEHKGHVVSAVFSPKGTQILTAQSKNTIKLWDLGGNLKRKILNNNDSVSSAVFSPNGKRILIAFWNKKAELWDLNGTPIKQFKHRGAVNSAVFSPCGNKVLTASNDGTAVLWDLDGQKRLTLRHKGKVRSSVFSPNGTRILTASEDQYAILWNLKGEVIYKLKHNDTVSTAVFSPNGERILSGDKGGSLKIWILDNQLVIDLGQYTQHVDKAVLSPKDSEVLCISHDGRAKLLNLVTNHTVDLNKHDESITSASFSPNGQRILTTSSTGNAEILDLEGNKVDEINNDSGFINSAHFSSSGKQILIVSREGIAKLLNLEKNTTFVLNKGDEFVHSAQFSQDENRILIVTNYRNTKVFELKTMSNTMIKHNEPILSATFSPDSLQILAVFRDGTAKVWDAREEKKIFKISPREIIISAEFSPNSDKILTFPYGGVMKVWEYKKGPMYWSDVTMNLWSDFSIEDKTVINAIFPPEGNQILTISDDGTARIMDLQYSDKLNLFNMQGNIIAEIKHNRMISYALFSKKSKYLLTASKDGMAKLWDMQGNLLASLYQTGSIKSAQFSSDNQRILTVSNSGEAKLWHTPEAIYKWLGDANIQTLSEEERITIGIPSNEAD